MGGRTFHAGFWSVCSLSFPLSSSICTAQWYHLKYFRGVPWRKGTDFASLVFQGKIDNVKTGILFTGSGNSAIDMALGNRQVGCRCTKVAFSLDFVAANGNSDSVLFTFGG